MQLPKELVEYLKSNENTQSEDLIIKSPSDSKNELVLCTPSKTWKVRQMNHSNTVLLVNNMNVNKLDNVLEPMDLEGHLPDKLVGFANLSYEYELSKVSGSVSTNGLPTYDGKEVTDGVKRYTIEELVENSPISKNQFFQKWYQLRGSEVDGMAVILTKEYVNEVLQNLIPILISNNIAYDTEEFNLDIEKITSLMKQQNSSFTAPVITTILNKFGYPKTEEVGNQIFRLNNGEISRWFGIQALITNNSKVISPKEFLISWKSSFPPFYNVPIELKLLRGHYYRPVGENIQYLNPEQLSDNDISSRIKDLFAVVKEWDFDDFIPYVAQFIPAGKKPDAVILKYARKKRVGKKFVVCPR